MEVAVIKYSGEKTSKKVNLSDEVFGIEPNDHAIYLHDTPDKSLFEKDDRWISNGCIRVEDAKRLAAWLFGSTPTPVTGQPEERADIADPVPVYITYLTAEAGPRGVAFRPDRYGRDPAVMARYFGGRREFAVSAR